MWIQDPHYTVMHAMMQIHISVKSLNLVNIQNSEGRGGTVQGYKIKQGAEENKLTYK